MPKFLPNLPRFFRNAVMLIGLGLIVGGIAWHDVAYSLSVCGFGLVCMAVFGMIMTRRN